MAEIILDIGSGRSLHDMHRSMAMLGQVADMDSHKHKIIFKAQLFQDQPPNIPLDHKAFAELYYYAKKLGYELTASVFDLDSLRFLLHYKPVFVKIACRPSLHWLIGEVPRKVPVYVSADVSPFAFGYSLVTVFQCVSKYPADIEDYGHLYSNVSDHTIGWEMFRNSISDRWEKHLCPEREADNPDSGPFACTTEELREVIA